MVLVIRVCYIQFNEFNLTCLLKIPLTLIYVLFNTRLDYSTLRTIFNNVATHMVFFGFVFSHGRIIHGKIDVVLRVVCC